MDDAVSYTHNRRGSSDTANALADELCELLGLIADEARKERLAQCEAGVTPALPWNFDIYRLAYGSMCANSMTPIYVEATLKPYETPCRACGEMHPKDES